MDEPFGALDPLTRAEIQREFQALQKRLQKTIIFVTHDMREALLLGSRIALLEAGKTVGVSLPMSLCKASDPMVAAYSRHSARAMGNPTCKSRPQMETLNFFVKTTAKSFSSRLNICGWWESPCCWQWPSACPWDSAYTAAGAEQTRNRRGQHCADHTSLALFGFLLPAPWLGERADRLAITALTLYALLP